jgi:hypothetical protein
MEKNYVVEFLYDNGLKEEYKTGLVNENEIGEFLKVIYNAFQGGTNAVLTLPNDGGTVMIAASKVTRFILKDQ